MRDSRAVEVLLLVVVRKRGFVVWTLYLAVKEG
jgi:hypothetical protein